jgi:ABC-type sugar transport system substrate-binding protein
MVRVRTRARARVRVVSILSVFLLGGILGCGQGAFLPPRPTDLDTLPDQSKLQSSGTIALVLGSGDTLDQLQWSAITRKEVNRAKLAFTLSRPVVGDSPSAQAKLIRDAVEPGVAVLIVEPMDDPEVVKTLNEVRAQGLPIVLLGHSVPHSDPSRPFVLVSYAPTEPVYKKLAEAAVLNAKNQGLPADGTALVLSDEIYPVDDRGRVREILEALKKAGVAKVESFRIPRDPQKSRDAIEARVKDDPKVTILVGTEENALQAALQAKTALPVGRALSVVGCTSFDRTPDPALTAAAALVDLNVPDLAREATRLAIQLARGEQTPPESVIPVTFHTHAEYVTEPSRKSTSEAPKH